MRRRDDQPTGGRPLRRRNPERGGATVEAALALPSLVLVLGVLLWGMAAVTGELRCVDAARVAARAAARGESDAAAVTAAQRLAPDKATVRIRRDGELVRVEVTAEIGAGAMVGRLVPELTVVGAAAVAAEQL